MLDLPVSKKVIMAVGIPSTIFFLYWLFWPKEEDEEIRRTDRVATSKQTVIEVKVPAKAVGTVIGRQGSKIKEIQKTSGARVHFCDDDRQGEERLVQIRGSSECAQLAELMIREIIANIQEIITEEMVISAKAVGRIIGKGGDSIRNISQTSNARVFIERTADNYREVEKKVQITGTRTQIDLAKELIQEKLDEEEVFRAKKAVMEANREKRPGKNTHNSGIPDERPTAVHNGEQHPASSYNSEQTYQNISDPNAHETQICQWPQGNKEYVEVYVSSVANPTTFWVQILSSMSLQLDDLVQTMTTYYSSKEMQKTETIDASLGTVVAAPFDQDSSWYRAKVMGYQDDKVDLYYVDYGDSCYLQKDRMRQLRADFTTLPYQAVECELAHVRPTGDSWPDDVIDKFEDLTHCAKWKVVFGKRIRTKHLQTGDKVEVIELIDTMGEKDVNIGEDLVAQNVAAWTADPTKGNVPQISG